MVVKEIDLFEQALRASDRVSARAILQGACQNKPVLKSLESLVVPVLESMGGSWESGEIALSQIYMAGRICESLVLELLPDVSQTQNANALKIAITTLHDYHLLGKSLVKSVLASSGYQLIDYGRTTPDELVERVLKDDLDVVLVSVLMLPSALKIRLVTEQLRTAGSKARVVVGGAPFRFDAGLWKEVGADAMGRTAVDAVTVLNAMRNTA